MYEEVGSQRVLFDKVTKIFYDAVFKDPWLKPFFSGLEQEHLEKQQADFMIQNMGGPKIYTGKFPAPAHQHMFISEELFGHRQSILAQALDDAGASEAFKNTWLKIDSAFKTAIVKSKIEDCKKRYNNDQILIFENPYQKKFA